MAIAAVQKAYNKAFGNSVTATWGGSTTINDALIAVVSSLSLGPRPVITTPAGWVLATQSYSPAIYANIVPCVSIYYIKNSPVRSGGEVFLVPNSVYTSATIAEYSGLTGTGTLDMSATAFGNSTSPSTGTTSTTTVSAEICVAGILMANGGIPSGVTLATPTNSFTLQENTSAYIGIEHGQADAYLDKIVAAMSTYSTGLTASVANPWVGAIATFS